MIGKSSSNDEVVTLPEVLEILEARKKSGELGYEQQLAYELGSRPDWVPVALQGIKNILRLPQPLTV